MTAHDADLVDRVAAWLAQDPDDDTRAELRDLVDRAGDDAAARDELAARFDGRLEFGTAGLRGELGAGPTRMNRVVVAQAAAGLAAYLLETAGPAPSVVVAHDARHGSHRFALDTAEVLAGAGVRPLLLDGPLPTPVLAFAIRTLGCAAGVMVTASHNPPRDNGYKVYLGDGSQIVPPADADIASAIGAVGPVDALPRGTAYADPADLTPPVREAYAAQVAALAGDGPRGLSWAYTPMHGVGLATVLDVVARAGFPAPHVVAEQAEPDPDFPTVAFPNPEEPGAMDLALALAEREGVDVVVANDPDADRCALGVRDAHGWRMLTGDETGVLLADLLLRRGTVGTYATTIVSSSLLDRLAAAHGQPSVRTLTGFKWLGRVDGLAYGYEEALGYAVAPAVARDKDGISALVLALALVAELAAEGRTLLDRLDDLAVEHGLHATSQLSVRSDDPVVLRAAVQRLREHPPTSLGGLAVDHVDDLAAGSDDLPPTDGLRLVLAGGARVVVRPSGTEPKLKCYLEVVVGVDAGGVPAARIAAAGRLDAIRDDLSALVSA